jgi:ribonuclease HII
MPVRRQLRAFDLKQLEGIASLIGVDEVGRGALAGPVVAGAVLVSREFLEGRWAVSKAGRVNDSKQLSAEARNELCLEFEILAKQGEIHATFGVADVAEVEQFNILGATKLAMRRAIEGIYPPSAFEQQVEPDLFTPAEVVARFQPTVSCRVLIDGLALRKFPYPHHSIISGDARSLCIAMASIIAKVERDRLMTELELKHPGYGFAQHKGYGTPEHCEALLQLGRCVQHRDLFLRRLFAQRLDPAQLEFLTAEE